MTRPRDPNGELHREIRTEITRRENEAIRDSVDVDAAASLLGISPTTLRRRIKAGSIAVMIVRGKTLISKNELRRLFQA